MGVNNVVSIKNNFFSLKAEVTDAHGKIEKIRAYSKLLGRILQCCGVAEKYIHSDGTIHYLNKAQFKAWKTKVSSYFTEKPVTPVVKPTVAAIKEKPQIVQKTKEETVKANSIQLNEKQQEVSQTLPTPPKETSNANEVAVNPKPLQKEEPKPLAVSKENEEPETTPNAQEVPLQAKQTDHLVIVPNALQQEARILTNGELFDAQGPLEGFLAKANSQALQDLWKMINGDKVEGVTEVPQDIQKTVESLRDNWVNARKENQDTTCQELHPTDSEFNKILVKELIERLPNLRDLNPALTFLEKFKEKCTNFAGCIFVESDFKKALRATSPYAIDQMFSKLKDLESLELPDISFSDENSKAKQLFEMLQDSSKTIAEINAWTNASDLAWGAKKSPPPTAQPAAKAPAVKAEGRVLTMDELFNPQGPLDVFLATADSLAIKDLFSLVNGESGFMFREIPADLRKTIETLRETWLKGRAGKKNRPSQSSHYGIDEYNKSLLKEIILQRFPNFLNLNPAATFLSKFKKKISNSSELAGMMLDLNEELRKILPSQIDPMVAKVENLVVMKLPKVPFYDSKSKAKQLFEMLKDPAITIGEINAWASKPLSEKEKKAIAKDLSTQLRFLSYSTGQSEYHCKIDSKQALLLVHLILEVLHAAKDGATFKKDLFEALNNNTKSLEPKDEGSHEKEQIKKSLMQWLDVFDLYAYKSDSQASKKPTPYTSSEMQMMKRASLFFKDMMWSMESLKDY